MIEDIRVFRCASCNEEVCICRACDRGHVYCAGECAAIRRRAAQRIAAAKYQRSRRGAQKHAARQAQQRAVKLSAQKVTHHGFPPPHVRGIVATSAPRADVRADYACFLYAPSGHAEHLEKLFEGRTLGSVTCDGSATNNCVEKKAGGRRGGCNAHGRRGLVEALRLGDARAVPGLALYAKLFHVDAESARRGETLEQRFERRLHDSPPIVSELRAWLDLRRGDVEPKTVLGKAVGYLHRQWSLLTAFLRDPRMELTNNEVESGLRPWVLDRKTWMFVGHEVSARRTADALSLVTTCRKMGLDPRAYLRDTLAKLLAGEKNLTELLPETYAAAHAERAPPSAAA